LDILKYLCYARRSCPGGEVPAVEQLAVRTHHPPWMKITAQAAFDLSDPILYESILVFR
jgi:hypothetical protein